MVRITNIRIGVASIQHKNDNEAITGKITDAEEEAILGKICSILRCGKDALLSLRIEKKSIDARKKTEIAFIYTVMVEAMDEARLRKRIRGGNVSFHTKEKEADTSFSMSGASPYQKSVAGSRPVVVGMGPAGLFCAYRLAQMGLCPILLERGMDVDARVDAVNHFWETGELNENTNVQFGEGGAGTFSDGKLSTMVKDASGRAKKVLNVFVEHGAPSEIAYLAKPHIGTDKLRGVVKNIRTSILSLGGEIRFQTKLSDVEIEGGKVKGCRLANAASEERLSCDVLILAIGHSARDTFSMLYENKVVMTSKPFAVGVRIEHSQSRINASQYGAFMDRLPPADYKLTHRTADGRGVYSFCMCPGGFVVNASSEKYGLAINGMSNYNRDGSNANSAIVVTVTPEDFIREAAILEGNPVHSVPEVFMGMEFQKKYEMLAYQAAGGRIPVQTYGDFKQNKESKGFGFVTPNTKGRYKMANVRSCLPLYVGDAIVEGIGAFDGKVRGFADSDAVVSGIETRTSSPVRIVRDVSLQSNIKGLYPCGEGAGYAGGIMSAAMDGWKVAEAVASRING